MADAFTQWGEPLPATTPRPEPTKPGMVVHSYFDLSAYTGSVRHQRYVAAGADQEKLIALEDMPDATVKFYQLPEGERFFFDPDLEDDHPPLDNV